METKQYILLTIRKDDHAGLPFKEQVFHRWKFSYLSLKNILFTQTSKNVDLKNLVASIFESHGKSQAITIMCD